MIEATHEAEREYSALCEQLAANSLFWKVRTSVKRCTRRDVLTVLTFQAEDNWIFGANIPGKKRCLRFFFGGMQAYCGKLAECANNGYAGFKPFAERGE